MYSSIKRKTCRCGCSRMPTLGCAGYSYQCMPEELKAKVGDKKKLQQKRLNASKYASTKLRMDNYKNNNELELWFKARREQMNGYCTECSRSTNKMNDKFYRWSICHVVPKGLLPSVATNYHNWLELCQDCHNKFDSTFETASKMKCFHEAKLRFQLFKHLIPAEELRKVNPFLND